MDELSPEQPCLIAQDTLEPLLRQAAADADADVRFGTHLTDVQQDGQGVIGTLADHGTTHARHLIAADGAHSGIRQSLGITRSGRADLGEPSTSVYFRAGPADVVRGCEFNLCEIEHPDAPGRLASVDGRTRWVFGVPGGRTGRNDPEPIAELAPAGRVGTRVPTVGSTRRAPARRSTRPDRAGPWWKAADRSRTSFRTANTSCCAPIRPSPGAEPAPPARQARLALPPRPARAPGC
jgi:2-polyprenyl-6-methoxyphenol hydroxylase-like FAD-dependent oxidoreductase